jgi:hypothetical protein
LPVSLELLVLLVWVVSLV